MIKSLFLIGGPFLRSHRLLWFGLRLSVLGEQTEIHEHYFNLKEQSDKCVYGQGVSNIDLRHDVSNPSNE